jgi:hypothetical protein
MSFQFRTTLQQFFEIPLEISGKLIVVLQTCVSRLSAVADHNRLTIERRAEIVVFFAET